MSESNIIKSITTHSCPHCGQDVFVESQMSPPVVTSIFTEEDVRTAKKDLLAKLETLDIDEDRKDDVRKWLNMPETIFGKEEVESIVTSLLTPKE